MNDYCYDLAIAYRIYPGVSRQPLVCSDSKVKLAELCLRSFRQALGMLKFKMWVLLDNCPPEYENLFEKYFAKDQLEFIKLNGIGDAATLNLQLKILSEQNLSEIVYLAEDDYFYLPISFGDVIKFLKDNADEVDFISPYDHLDYYSSDLHKGCYQMKIFGKQHWRTANSTCHTFLTTKSTLQQTKSVFSKYAIGSFDSCNWISLTKSKLDLATMFNFLQKEDKFLWEVFKRAWLNNWQQILYGKRWKLWVPVPSMATHLESTCAAPTINWLSFMKKEIEAIEGKDIETLTK